MKILILSRGIPNSKDPQEGCFELDQAKALKAAGHDVTLMAVDSRVRKFWRNPGITKRVIEGITTYKLFLFPTSIIRHLISFPFGIYIEVKEALSLYKYVTKKEGNFDLIHAHFLTNIFYAIKIKEAYGIPVVGTEHWSKVNTEHPTSDVLYMATEAYKNTNKLITVSKSLKDRIANNFSISSKVIHNLIDTSFLSSLCKTRNNVFTIALVGSLINRKGFDFFIKSFKKSKLSQKKVKVEIIGGGEEFHNLQSLIKKLGLEYKVYLRGQQNKSTIFNLLNQSDMFILPSRNENFSVSVLEALANGLPVIATICGGIRECIDESNGLLVEVDNEEQMVTALEDMYDNYHRYDRRKIRENCLALYSPENIAQQINEVYESVIDHSNV